MVHPMFARLIDSGCPAGDGWNEISSKLYSYRFPFDAV